VPANEKPVIRIVSAGDGEPPTLTIFINDSGQLALIRAIAKLAPSDRHRHLAPLLTVRNASSDISDVDLVFTEGDADVAHAPL
jgi:hypothetical protein